MFKEVWWFLVDLFEIIPGLLFLALIGYAFYKLWTLPPCVSWASLGPIEFCIK